MRNFSGSANFRVKTEDFFESANFRCQKRQKLFKPAHFGAKKLRFSLNVQIVGVKEVKKVKLDKHIYLQYFLQKTTYNQFSIQKLNYQLTPKKFIFVPKKLRFLPFEIQFLP
jgi:hypothetical protein